MGPWRTELAALSLVTCSEQSLSQVSRWWLLCFQALDPYSLYLWAPSCSVSALTPAMQQGNQVLVGQVLPGCCRGTEMGHWASLQPPSLENPCPCLEFPKWLHQGNQGNCPHNPCLLVGS